MRSRRQAPEEEKPRVPAYIITYSDMVTLLLTFFVLLLVMAGVQDPEMFNLGRDSFWQSIRLCGLGALLGPEVVMDLGARQTKHLTTDPESSEDRTLDEYRERLRRAYERITHSAATLNSQLHAQKLDFSVADVRFPKGEVELDDEAIRSLSKFCLDLRQNRSAQTCRLYVLGLAGDETSETQQWVLSAERARAVASFLNERLNQDGQGQGPAARKRTAKMSGSLTTTPWQILWWGAGPGGHWAGQDRPHPGESQILIAILKTES